MANLDANFNPQVFRKDFPQILATNRHLASFDSARLLYDAAGYAAGVCVARRTDGLYGKYVNGGASGLGTAAGFLFAPIDPTEFSNGTGTAVERFVYGGELLNSVLTGNDSAADTQLGARRVTGADGVTIYKF